MTQFTRTMLTTFGTAGLPSESDAQWQWLNLDHVERISEHIHTEPPGTINNASTEKRFIAFLVLTMCSGEILALPAGTHDSDDAALDALVHTRRTQLDAH